MGASLSDRLPTLALRRPLLLGRRACSPLVDKLIICLRSEDAEAIYRLSKPLAAVWNIAVQTVGLADMQFLQANH